MEKTHIPVLIVGGGMTGLSLTIDIHSIGGDGDLVDQEGRWAKAYGGTPTTAVLVRPDGFIAWRAQFAGPSPEHELAQVLAHMLCRENAPSPL